MGFSCLEDTLIWEHLCDFIRALGSWLCCKCAVFGCRSSSVFGAGVLDPDVCAGCVVWLWWLSFQNCEEDVDLLLFERRCGCWPRVCGSWVCV